MRAAHRTTRFGAALAIAGAALPASVNAQTRMQVDQEHREFAEWLRTAPVSPLRAVVVRPIDQGITLGPPTADLPLEGALPGRVTQRDGRIILNLGKETLPLIRGRATKVASWSLVANGPAGRAALTVYRAEPTVKKEPHYYPYDPALVYRIPLTPTREARSQRLLTPDGMEVEANDAGTVEVPIPGGPVTLRVMRLPGATEDESELEIFFRDGTSDHGSYPAGRFVSLIPVSDGRYLLDFNRARNPFCAYNTVYPCPAPWRGNLLTQSVNAGERYAGGELDKPLQ